MAHAIEAESDIIKASHVALDPSNVEQMDLASRDLARYSFKTRMGLAKAIFMVSHRKKQRVSDIVFQQ
ncbi:MAG: hypothetical protein CFE44_02925 [Burkholderiales bacterium PBB4]|nr:MAG: hypothetical protein CFE44_02925 [Burkholderiales bacterium PBB4]